MSAYLDHASGWPLSDEVQDAMARWTRHVGSPMSLHEQARAPADAIEDARDEVAALTGWAPEAVIFTAGATEARNLAIKGPLGAAHRVAPVIAADPLAHASTLAVARSATRHAGALRLAGVDGQGHPAPGDVTRLAAGADVVVITHGQAEVGTIRDAAMLVARIRDAAPGAVIVLDAEETAGLVPLDAGLGADLVVIGGRSLGGPAWAGALLVRPGIHLHPLIEGGVEEGGKRGGPHDVPAIAALAMAARLARPAMRDRVARMRAVAHRLANGLLSVPGTRLNGPPVDERLPGHVQVSTAGVTGEAVALAMATRGVAVSPGSACAFGAGKASPVLEAMGLGDDAARSAVLLTAGPGTTDADADSAIAAFAASVAALRAMAPG